MLASAIRITVEAPRTNRIVRIFGDIDTVTAPELENTLSSLRTEDSLTFLIDMQSVGYISSMGLRVFLNHLKKTRASGSRMVLAGANQLVIDVFRMSGFLSYFEMIDNLDGALAEFA